MLDIQMLGRYRYHANYSWHYQNSRIQAADEPREKKPQYTLIMLWHFFSHIPIKVSTLNRNWCSMLQQDCWFFFFWNIRTADSECAHHLSRNPCTKYCTCRTNSVNTLLAGTASTNNTAPLMVSEIWREVSDELGEVYFSLGAWRWMQCPYFFLMQCPCRQGNLISSIS